MNVCPFHHNPSNSFISREESGAAAAWSKVCATVHLPISYCTSYLWRVIWIENIHFGKCHYACKKSLLKMNGWAWKWTGKSLHAWIWDAPVCVCVSNKNVMCTESWRLTNWWTLHTGAWRDSRKLRFYCKVNKKNKAPVSLDQRRRSRNSFSWRVNTETLIYEAEWYQWHCISSRLWVINPFLSQPRVSCHLEFDRTSVCGQFKSAYRPEEL